jgi:LPS O-antigen subunit length determinant protein (WzzB/FepE family)
MKYVIEMDVDNVVQQELREVYKSFINYLESDTSNVFFFNEPAKERIALAQHAEAARLIHNYYAIAEDRIEP